MAKQSDSEETLVVVAVRNDAKIRWFRSQRDLWVLDLNKWRDEFIRQGYDVPEFQNDYRAGIHSVDQKNATDFLEYMSPFEVSKDSLSRELAQRYVSASSWWDVGDLFPIMFVDFDGAKVAAFYPDGTPMERYVPDGWESEFVDFANTYSAPIFPDKDKFWIKGGADLLKLLNKRGAAQK
ncbi:MAG: group-specific protein [Cyanobacteria bacterium J06627_28]